MVYAPQSSTGQHALDEVQLHAAQVGYGWESGLEASLTSSTTAIESQWTAGSVLWNGESISIPSGTITHDAGDPDNPRWDALVVSDSGGTVQIVKGTPSPIATDDSGTTYAGEQAWTPSPSDQITRDMVVFAMVWIPAGAANNDDLTNTSANGVSEPVVDRRVEVSSNVSQITQTATISSSGWYRIASNGPVADGGTGGGVASGTFTIRVKQSSVYSSATFYASTSGDSEHPALTMVNSSFNGDTDEGVISAVRLITGTDGEGAAIEVNVQLRGQTQIDTVEYTLSENYGWTSEPFTTGSVPTGFFESTVQLRSDGMLFAGASRGNTNAISIGNTGRVLCRDVIRDETATKLGLSSTLATGTGSYIEVQFDTVEFDDYSAASGKYILAPFGGTYRCTTSIGYFNAGTDQYNRTRITQNGTTIFDHRDYLTTARTVRLGGVVNLTAGDELAVEYYTDLGSLEIRGGNEETYFELEHIG